MNYLLIIAISLVCMLGGRWLFKKRKLLDKPKADQKQARKPVPTLLWIFLFISFVLVVAIVFPEYLHNSLFRGLIIAGVIIVLPALLDELHYLGYHTFKVSPLIRLFTQMIWSGVALWIAGISVEEVSFFGSHLAVAPWIFFVGFAIRAVLCINAINWFDYANGQSSGVAGIGFLTIFLLVHLVVIPHYPTISIEHLSTLLLVKNLSFILFILSSIGAMFEWRPIGLLRDVGTMFLWFSLAYLSVIGGAKIGTLVVSLSLVMFDAIRVGIHRIFVLKSNPMNGDYRHIHHRLIRLGRSRGEVRAFVWIFSLVMMILMLLQGGNSTGKIIIFILMALIFFGVNAYLFWVKKLPVGMEK